MVHALSEEAKGIANPRMDIISQATTIGFTVERVVSIVIN